jgi:hypothetical protein
VQYEQVIVLHKNTSIARNLRLVRLVIKKTILPFDWALIMKAMFIGNQCVSIEKGFGIISLSLKYQRIGFLLTGRWSNSR